MVAERTNKPGGQLLGDKTFYIYSVLDSILKARFWFGYEWGKQTAKRREIIICEQMLDGAPPQEQEKLEAAGLGYMVNKNFGEARFQSRSVESNYWALSNEVKNVAEFQIDLDDPELQPLELQAELATTWHKCLKAWPAFSTKRQLVKNYIARFGSGMIVFPDPDDYHYEVIHPTNVILPLESRNYISDWYTLAVIHPYTPEQLWKIYYDENMKEMGWNKQALGELLLISSNIYGSLGGAGGVAVDQFREFESMCCTDINGVGQFYKSNFRLVSIYARQKDGTITHAIMDKNYTTSDFIFKKEKVYKKFEEFCFLYTFQPGVEYYHQNIGVAQDTFEMNDAITQTDCRVLDQIHRSSTLFVSSGTGVNQDARGMDLILGAINDLAGGQLQQSNIFNAIGPTIEAANYLRQNLANAGVLGGFNAQAPDPKAGAPAVELRANKESKVYKSYTAHHYDEDDCFLKLLFRRFLETSAGAAGYRELKWFKKRLERSAFPMELLKMDSKNLWDLPEAIDVTAARIMGSGSQIGDQFLAERLLSKAGFLGQVGKKNVAKYAFAVDAGYEHLQTFFPPEDESNVPNNDASIATLENSMIMLSMPVEFGANQNHLIHAATHMKVGTDLMNEIESHQLDPKKYKAEADEDPVIIANDVLNLWAPHVVKHLRALDDDPFMRGEAKQLMIAWGTIVNFGRKMQAAAQSVLQRKAGEQEKLTEKEMMLAKEDQLAQQEIQLKHQREIQKLNIKAGEIARQQDIETLLGLERAKGDNAVKVLKQYGQNREKMLQELKKPSTSNQ